MKKINPLFPRSCLTIICIFLASTALCNEQPSETAKRKIITAGSAVTEVVCALGYCDDIIATDRTSVYPHKMQALPSIGYRNGINAENIIAQGPDLILAETGYVRDEIIDQLESTKIEFHALIDPLSFEDTRTLIRQVAKILNVVEKGEQLIESMESDWQAIENSLAGIATKPKLLFILSRGPGAQMIAGDETFAVNLFKMVSAQNAVTDLTGFKPLNAEALINSNPDYVVFGGGGPHGLSASSVNQEALKIPGMAQTTAGQKLQFVTLDLVMMSNFGPRLMQAVRELAGEIHPELKNELTGQ